MSTDPRHARLLGATAQLGLAPDDAQALALLQFLDLLRRWNATYNLTALRDPDEMLVQHLFDCLAAIPPLKRALAGRPGRVLDVGSGGGLPGVVVAIVCPELSIRCVDTVGKKVAFLRQAIAELRLKNLDAIQGRVESLKADPFDLITSRAFASLLDFTRWTRPLLRPDGVWMAMKARPPTEEIAALPAEVSVFHVEPLQVPELAAERCLVWMRPV